MYTLLIASPTHNPSQAAPTEERFTQVISPEPGLFVAVGQYLEDCNAACARHSLYCNEGSLEAALPYTTEDTFQNLLSQFGIECDSIWPANNWSSYPSVRFSTWTGCAPSDSRRRGDGYRCDRISTQVNNSRICTCFNIPTAAPTETPTATPTTIPTTAVPTAIPTARPTATAVPSGVMTIASSVPRELLRLTRVSRLTNVALLAGRSYDGNPWESAPPLNFLFECDTGAGADTSACNVTIPVDETDEYDYQIEPTYSVPVPEPQVIASRFLFHTSFGPTRSSIDQFISEYDGNPVSWITSQMQEPASLHRVYYRERANPRLPVSTVVGDVRSPCVNGSRWHRFALSGEDSGKLLQVILIVYDIL